MTLLQPIHQSCVDVFEAAHGLTGGGNEVTGTDKVLRRSRHNRVIAGVCGGLSEFFGISAFWFRLAFLLALLPGGIPGILIYLILWIIIPKA